MRRILFACLIGWFAVVVNAAEYYFLSQPDISPDGRTVVFCYNGDIWSVATTGGTARRLTAMAGEETRPRISPDGEWLAFSGMLEGNRNVYVMPMAGGPITQLTFHDGNDNVDSWSWDSQTLYFSSSRANGFTEFALKRAGGTPRRLLRGYFNTIHGVAVNPRDGALWFTDTWESQQFANRKGYKGAYNPDLKSYNLETGEFAIHTRWEGKDFAPTFSRSGNVYFLSDRADPSGGVTNLFTLEQGVPRQLTHSKVSVRNPRVSADGSAVVLEMGYRLHLFSPATGEIRLLAVRLSSDPSLTIETAHDVKGKIEAFDVAPDQKKLAFVSRGELFVSDMEGKFVRKLDTRIDGRVMEVKWLKDNRTLLFNQTLAGWLNWFTISATGKGKEKRITNTESNNRNLSLNSARTLGVYLSGRREVKLMDLETLESATLTEENLWGFFNAAPRFSPDDAWVVFTAFRNFEQDLFLYHRASGKTLNITDTGVTESDPVFSPDGKYLYFSSDRIHPGFPRGSNQTHIYRVALERMDRVFRADEFDDLFTQEKKPESKKKDKASGETAPAVQVKVDLKRLLERYELISPARGTQYSPCVMVDDDAHVVVYSSDHEDGKRALYLTDIKPFEKNKTRKIAKSDFQGRGNPDFVTVDKQAWVLLNGGIHSLDPGQATLKAIDISFGFTRRMGSEFTQMFDEVWANIQENYYDENFHGRDWKAIRERYRAFLPYLTDRNDLKMLLNDMLGELNSSHQGFYSRGKEEKTFFNQITASAGIVFSAADPWVVERILTDSPLDKGDKDVKPGDRLLAVNGEKVSPEQNREKYFRFPELPAEMTLTFQRAPGEVLTVRVHPESSAGFRDHAYQRWEEINQERVDRLGAGQIAYIHMRNMGGRALQKFFLEMTSEQYRRRGLILDLRNNTGGNVHDAVLNLLARKLYAKWKYRGDGAMSPQPNFTPADKPMVLLVNEQTLSDGEMTAAGFKALKLGTVVGTKTYRWLIFTTGLGLVDGSYFRLPSWGCYTVEGKDIENHGVAPDVEVPLTVKDKHLGHDPQLEKAVKIILKQLK